MDDSHSQLRSFHIKKPWARQQAEEEGGDAVASWGYESDTPPLDQPPPLSTSATEALDTLFKFIPGEDAPFDYGAWDAINTLTDLYIKRVGDLFQAAHGYTAKWRRGAPLLHLPPQGIGLFNGIVDEQLYDYASRVATHGVHPHGGRPPVRFRQQAYSNVQDNPRDTAAELWGDVLKGRLLAFTVASETFTSNLMESKLAYVSQKDATDPDSTEVRYISDPRNEVNERIHNEHHPQCVIPRHQNVARRVM